MSNENNIDNNDNLYELIGDYGPEITSRSSSLIFNDTKIDWISQSQNNQMDRCESQLSSSASSKIAPIDYLVSPRTESLNDKAQQNIDLILPPSFKSRLRLSSATDHSDQRLISCPDCRKLTASNLNWCLFCGLFLIAQNNNNHNRSGDAPIAPQIASTKTVDKSPRIDYFSTKSTEDFDRLFKKSKSVDRKIDNGDCESGAERVAPVVVVPRLDLSNIDAQVADRECGEKQVDNNKKIDRKSKENRRKWDTSAIDWKRKPVCLMKKKPAGFYQPDINNDLNHRSIGLTVFPSKINQSIEIDDEMNDYERSDRNGVNNNCDLDLRLDVSMENGFEHVKIDETTINDSLQSSNKAQINGDRVSVMRNSWESCEGMVVKEGYLSHIEDTGGSKDNEYAWHCLPAELWLRIMRFMPQAQLVRLQRVCRRLHSIGLDPQLWRSITLFRHNSLTDEQLKSIARHNPLELHFKNCCGANITFSGLKEMFKRCGNGLQKLSFISCSKGALEGDQCLLLSAIFCPNVTHINASYLVNLQDSTLISMTQGFQRIVSINLMGAHSISNHSIRALIDNHRSSLVNLDLYGCFKLNSATLHLLQDCLHLRSLALGSINKLKRAAMIDLLRKLSQLISLDLRGTMNLIDDLLLEQICSLCPNLQQMVLTNSCLVGNEGLSSLANSNVSKTLKVLDVCGCSKITDKGIEAILKNCLSLEDLDISCTGITGRITKLFNIYPPPNLKCLRVNNNKLISESELTSIIKSSKKLNTIYMCGITAIDTWRFLESKYQHILFKHE